MLKGILVGIDGSPYSESALKLAIRWAKDCNAMVVGLGIIDEPSIHRAEALPIGGTYYKTMQGTAMLADARRKVDRSLEDFGLQCAREQVAFKPLEDVGSPAAQIELESQRYDLVLLGKETHFEFQTKSQPDDTLVRVLRHGHRPVVTVALQLPDTKRVLVAYDGSPQAARALQAFEATGLAVRSDVHVVTVADSRLEAARIADRAVQFLSLHGIVARAIPLESRGQPANAVLDQAQRVAAGLLVMGAFGKPSMREFFIGTVTRQVLSNTTVPVFLYH